MPFIYGPPIYLLLLLINRMKILCHDSRAAIFNLVEDINPKEYKRFTSNNNLKFIVLFSRVL